MLVEISVTIGVALLTIGVSYFVAVCANMNETTPLRNLGKIVYNG